MINGMQHAREWVSGMTNMYIATKLLFEYETDQSIRTINWYIIPIVNCDGFAYSWSDDRLWRKNLRKGSSDKCKGVDINRNFDFKWSATGGESEDPCSEVYRGPKPFSEPESVALAKFLEGVNDLKLYVDFHSYSQLWMRPYGFTKEAPKDDALMEKLTNICIAKIKDASGLDYKGGRISTVIYEASGSSVDFAYGRLNTISFAVELRDTGKQGFLLHADQIIPTGEEAYSALISLSKYVTTI